MIGWILLALVSLAIAAGIVRARRALELDHLTDDELGDPYEDWRGDDPGFPWRNER